ncbi:MAG: tetratricopeptide repeat protein [Candidatus Sericytochromatia bacterium]
MISGNLKLISKKIKVSSIIYIILVSNIGYVNNAESVQYRKNYRPPYLYTSYNKPSSINKGLVKNVIPNPSISPSIDPMIEQQRIIEEKVNKLDKSVIQSKKDIVNSTEQVNKLRSEQNIVISENQDLKIKNNNLYNLVISLTGILLLTLLSFIFSIFKIRKNTNKTINDIRNEQITKSDEMIKERVKDFDNSIKDSLNDIKSKNDENNKVSLEDFEKKLSELIDKYIKDYSSKIDNQNNNPETLEVKRYLNSLIFKEKEISTKIERIHIANTYFNTANSLMKAKFYEDAIEEYQESIKANPSFYGAYLNLGKAYEKIKENEKAIETYNKAINLNPNYFKAYFNIACIYFDKGDYENAINNYEQVINLKSDNYKSYNNLAIINKIKGNKDKAKDYYKKALEFNKDYIEAYFNLSTLEHEQEKEDNKESNIYHLLALYTEKYKASKNTKDKLETLIEDYLKKKEIVKK